MARKNGEMLPLLCFGDFTTEEAYKQTQRARGEPEDFPAIPGVFALRCPYEQTVCQLSTNCPARYVNDCKGVKNAKHNVNFVQHEDPRGLFHDPMRGLHLFNAYAI